MKRIAIFLPSLCLTQSGGYKVIFDYDILMHGRHL